jgi:Uma2 family endonuclease
MSTATPTALMTGEEFVRLEGHELMSLVDGVPVVEESERSLWHGQVCAIVGCVLLDFVKPNRLGIVCGNNTSIRLMRNPDTVYGPDVCFFSAGRLTAGQRSAPVYDTIPELVVEVWLPSNFYPRLMLKARDYVAAGVKAVLVVDLEREQASVFRDKVEHFYPGDDVTLPDVLPGFTVPLKRFFE